MIRFPVSALGTKALQNGLCEHITILLDDDNDSDDGDDCCRGGYDSKTAPFFSASGQCK